MAFQSQLPVAVLCVLSFFVEKFICSSHARSEGKKNGISNFSLAVDCLFAALFDYLDTKKEPRLDENR